MTGRMSALMSTWFSFQSLRLVVRLDGAPEVDGGEGGEDEGLQGRHPAHFEEGEGEGRRDREPAESRDAEQHGQAAGHEEDQQVPREDVREETNGEADDP